MSWDALLESTYGLHRIGMNVPTALGQLARTGEGTSQMLAARWLSHRWRLGDPAEAIRRLAAPGPYERFVLETLAVCLERPAADHDRALSLAIEQLHAERATRRLRKGRASRTLRLALIVVALSAGDSLDRATERAVAAFGGRRMAALRVTLGRAQASATPTMQALENVLTEERSHERWARGRASWRALPHAVALALALTLAALGVVAHGSADLRLAGW